MSVSIGRAVSGAYERTKAMLFSPFDAGKWFIVGFCAWLAQLGQSSGVNIPNMGDFRKDGGAGIDFRGVLHWIQANMALVVGIGAVVFVLMTAFGMLFQWIRARGQFMFLDCVAHNRAAIDEPWHRYRRQGNSLFWFEFLFGWAVFAAGAAAVGLGTALAWPDIAARRMGAAAIVAIVVTGTTLAAIVVVALVVTALLRDFVAPVMYLTGQGVCAAWQTFVSRVLRGAAEAFVVFYLVRLVLSALLGIVSCVAVVCTCCCAALPYIGTVILLPVYVFGRSFSLCYLEQFGEEWRVLGLADPCAPPPVPPPILPPMPPVPAAPAGGPGAPIESELAPPGA